jgi:hypothetical protein
MLCAGRGAGGRRAGWTLARACARAALSACGALLAALSATLLRILAWAVVAVLVLGPGQGGQQNEQG